VTYIHTSLTELDDKMLDLDSDIKAFNFFVQTQVKSLAARGETSDLSSPIQGIQGRKRFRIPRLHQAQGE
jgi:hypothetical protein